MQQFYCDVLGFELTVVQHDKFVWIKRGGLEILIRPGDPRPSASRYEDAPTGFVFYTGNMEETLDTLKRQKGVEIKGTVDPDKCVLRSRIRPGNWFQLVDPNDM